MNNYQETSCVKKSDSEWHEMELRMTERLQIVKGLRLSDKIPDSNKPNIQFPTTRLS